MQNSQRPLVSGEAYTGSPVRISCGLINSAGDMAAEVATFFSFPHFGFLTLPPARMHLVGLAIAGIRADVIDTDRLNARKFADAACILADPCPIGLEGILGALTFPLWTAANYWKFWNTMHCAKAKKILAHATRIDPILVSILAELPPVLREARLVRNLRRPMEARVLASIGNDDLKAANLMQMLRNADERSDMYDKIVEFVEKSTRVPTPPQIDHELIRPILDVQQLSRTAKEFRNCLRSAVDEMVAGEAAFYVLDGVEPAVFSIEPRIGGYVITQIRGVRNAFVSDETKSLVRQAMTDSGLAVLKEKRRQSKLKWSLTELGLADDDDYRGIDGACQKFLGTDWATELAML